MSNKWSLDPFWMIWTEKRDYFMTTDPYQFSQQLEALAFLEGILTGRIPPEYSAPKWLILDH